MNRAVCGKTQTARFCMGMDRGKSEQHAEEVRKSDQLNRAEGSRGDPPCRVKGQRPLWGLGQRPNCFSSSLLKGRSQQGAGSEASLPVTSRSRRSAPKLLYQPLAHCRAKWARPNCLTSVSVCFPRTSSSIHHQKQTSTASRHAGLFFILLTFPAHPGWSAWAAPGLCPECTPGMPRSPADRHSPSR